MKSCFSLNMFAFLLFDRMNMFDVGGADEEEFADEHPFGNSEGLKGTEKLLFAEYFWTFFAFLLFDRINMFDIGGADEEEFADGNSEGLKGTEKLLFVEYFLHGFFDRICR